MYNVSSSINEDAINNYVSKATLSFLIIEIKEI